jgi:chemotaxis response regulator CheB
MGVDGREGARAVKSHGGTVISQDASTATIFGMPAAVAEAGLSDRVLPLQRIAGAIASWARTGRLDSAGEAGSEFGSSHLGNRSGIAS